MDVLRRSFRPEFINRIDEIIVFRALTDEQLVDITKLLLDKLGRRLRAQRIEVEVTDEANRLLSREGFDPEFGARPLRRKSSGSSRTSSRGWCSPERSGPGTRWSWTRTGTG